MTGPLQIFRNLFYQQKKGTFDDELFVPYLSYLRTICALPGVRIYWSGRAGWYPDDFRNFMKREIFAKANDTIYRKYLESENAPNS